MAEKLGAALTDEAEAIHTRALAGEKVPREVLKSARPLYEMAQDVGFTSSSARGKTAFIEGLAELESKAWKQAEQHFTEASKADGTNREYAYFRALALLQQGDRKQALKLLETDLKDDPRTATLRVAQALSESPAAGADELEKLLFEARNPEAK